MVGLTPEDAAYAYQNVGIEQHLTAEDAAYAYQNVSLEYHLNADDAAYAYQNVGLEYHLNPQDAAYAYQGVAPAPATPPAVPIVHGRVVGGTTAVFTWSSAGHSGSYEWENAANGAGTQKTISLPNQTPGTTLTLAVRAYIFDAPSGRFLYSDWGYGTVTIPPPVTAGIRKPPSQRNAEYTLSRQDRAIKAMAPGSMSGRVTNAAPTASSDSALVAPSGIDLGRPEIVFTTGQTPVAGASSAPYRVAVKPLNVVQISATLGTAGSTATTVTVQLNGTTFATATIASGATKANTDIIYALPVGGVVTAVATAVGTGAQYLTVQVRVG